MGEFEPVLHVSGLMLYTGNSSLHGTVVESAGVPQPTVPFPRSLIS